MLPFWPRQKPQTAPVLNKAAYRFSIDDAAIEMALVSEQIAGIIPLYVSGDYHFDDANFICNFDRDNKFFHGIPYNPTSFN